MNEQNAFEEDMIRLFESIGSSYGFDPLSTKIFALLYMEPGELTLQQLAERTGYSLSMVSTRMKPLESFGWVERVKRKGSRKVHFHMAKDMKTIVISNMTTALEKQVRPVKRQIPVLLERHKGLKDKDNPRVKDQFRMARKLRSRMVELESLLKEYIRKVQEL